MIPINRPGEYHESTCSFYARGLSRDKSTRAPRAGRGLAHPSSAPVEAGAALGSDHRGHDTPLAPPRQKRRWGARVALGCLLVCTFGCAHADQGLRFAPDGSVRMRERGGACLYWTSRRCPGADSRSLQYRAGLCGVGQSGDRRTQPPGDQGGAALWLCRRAGALGRYHGAGTAHWVSQRTGDLTGAGPTLWPGLDPDDQARDAGTRKRSGAGTDHLALGQRTPPLYLGQGSQARGPDADIERGGHVDCANTSAGRAARDECGSGDAECALAATGDARGDQAADEADRALDIDGAGGGKQNRACGDSPSPRHCAQQDRQEDGVWLGLPDQSLGRGLSVWDVDCSQCGREADAAQSAERIPGDLRPGGDTRVSGLRPRGRCDCDPQSAHGRAGQVCRDSAQGAAALVSCRGSPGPDSQRAGSDRGKHWDIEKQSIPIQQTEGAALAYAGDGGAEGYPCVQSEQIHAGFRGADPVRGPRKLTKRSQQRGRIQKQPEGVEASMTSNRILRHALFTTGGPCKNVLFQANTVAKKGG